MKPLVTCVCPTMASRAEFLPKMIDCFQAQTYPNKELLIVRDSGEPKASFNNGVSIRELPFEGGSLGVKRNFACRYSQGEIIAHFDDDDWSSPFRLSDQVATLETSGLAMTGYSYMKFTDGEKWWRYVQSNFTLGTSLCFLKSWWERHPFPDLQLGSDVPFVYQAETAKQLARIHCGDLMFARVHPGRMNKQSYCLPSFELLPASEAIAEGVCV